MAKTKRHPRVTFTRDRNGRLRRRDGQFASATDLKRAHAADTRRADARRIRRQLARWPGVRVR